MNGLVGKKGDNLLMGRCILVLPGGVTCVIGQVQYIGGQVVEVVDACPAQSFKFQLDDKRTFDLKVKE
jgi:hypothetical protein